MNGSRMLLAAMGLAGCLAITSCKGDGKDSGGSLTDADSCGDVDGEGGDSGDVPNIYGKWTVSFGHHLYDDNDCNLENLSQSDMKWFNSNMEIDGRPPDVYAYFDDDDEERFYGQINSSGGVVFTGMREQAGHNLYLSVGGLLYEVPQVDRDEIRGFGYVGVDIDGEDAVIDCWLQGDFVAKKSGN